MVRGEDQPNCTLSFPKCTCSLIKTVSSLQKASSIAQGFNSLAQGDDPYRSPKKCTCKPNAAAWV